MVVSSRPASEQVVVVYKNRLIHMKMNTVELMSRIERISSDYEEKPAVIDFDEEVTYRDLNRRAASLASEIHEVIETSGEQCGNKVALLLPHDANAIVGIIGAMKAGVTFVPLDSSYPADRLIYMLNDADAGILVTCGDNLELAYKLIHKSGRDISLINIESIDSREFNAPDTGSNDAYILYTSGSAGKPKGVVQDHNSINVAAGYLQAEFAVKDQDRLLLTTSCSHTVGILDIFMTLLSGATLYMYDIKTDFDKDHFVGYIRQHSISIIHTVPTFFRFFTSGDIQNESVSTVRLVALGGEAVTRNDFNRYRDKFSDHSYFVNLYGQSEVLIGTMNVLNKKSEVESDIVPIGYPVDLLDVKILKDGEEATVLNTGELHFKADWLNFRYHNQESLTSNTYTDDPAAGDTRMVKTGDMGRWLPDGTIEYIGREDHQCKVNGHRVHLREVEVEIESVTGVKSCIVTFSDEEEVLYAYVIQDRSVSQDEIMRFLKGKLPEYMLPKAIVALEEFPRLPNGKIDRQNMPAYIPDNSAVEKELPPEVVETLLEIWRDVMGDNSIKPDDNFFQLGGNSLHATEIVNKLYLKFRIDFELSIIFDNQSVYELAASVVQEMDKKGEMV